MIRAIYFDVVGTLIHPQPGVASVYTEAGRHHGSHYTEAQVAERFPVAFRKQEEIDRAKNWVTNEVREWRRWRDIVADVLDDARSPNICFGELYVHFSRAHSWSLPDEVEAVLSHLKDKGYTLGLASNYDRRLREVIAGIDALKGIPKLLISSEVGCRKPARGFYDALVQQAEVPAETILHVGDDRANDYEAARAAGLQAVLIDPVAPPDTSGHVIRTLRQLPELVARLADRRGSTSR